MNQPTDCTTNMPPQLARAFKSLWEDAVWLYREWEVFHSLFGESRDIVDLMNSSAPDFFRLVQDLLRQALILGICRLTDKPTSDKLVLRSLLKHIDAKTRGALKTEVGKKLDELERGCKTIRKHRNKKIAHTDGKVRLAAAGAGLPEILYGEIRIAVDRIAKVMNAVQLAYAGLPTEFRGFDEFNRVRRLITTLERAKAHKANRVRLSQPRM
jgi:AbiU2